MRLVDLESFGGIDADADPLLDECFEDHEAYKAALQGSKYLIIGRKGSGKTAIYRKILGTKTPNKFAFGHTFRDYPWHHHDKQRRSGVPEQECFAHSWKYLILITLSKVLLNHDQSQPWDEYSLGALSAIQTFVMDTYGTRDPDVSQVFQPSTKLRIRPELAFKIPGFEARAHTQEVEMDKLPTVIQEVNSNLMEKVVRSMNPENRYYVLFDELDLGLSFKDENYLLRLIGLIHAARDLNTYAKESGRSLNVVVFLRDDIYQTLQFEDKNKISESGMARIEWDSPRTQHTLKEVMSRRIANLLSVELERAWDCAFNEEKKMRGHQTKYQHIVDRTMLRPRDMIKFSNEILIRFRRKPSDEELFDNIHVQDARPEYSQYLLSELEDEIFKHIPNHASVFELLRDLEAVQFSIEEFEDIYGRRRELIPEAQSAKGILSQLFEFSIIGYYQPGGAGHGGAEYVFRYKSPRAMFNSNAGSYQVHLGLQEVLGLKRYRRTVAEASEEEAIED